MNYGLGSMTMKTRIATGSLLAICVFVLTLYCLPLPQGFDNQHYSKVLYSEDGELLSARIARDEQWRFPPPEKLPEKYITALLLFEDKRFYYHPGVDPIAVLRAIKSNVIRGEIVSGASTLTMQLARMISAGQPRTYWQKFKEVLIAFQLELKFSKSEILRHYATHAPFGGNNVGLAAANWRYFGHDMSKMTWAEAALFALLPNSPSSLSPGKNRDQLLIKRNRLLDRLHEQERINRLDLKLAKLEPLPLEPKAMPNRAPHLLATLSKKHAEKSIFETTVDSVLQ